ncbi:DUF6082 family protein [Streptomyces sp. Tu6071]|uniref:DUF6082 family protein n=1 Tax=Streptomyces sp. Tu6071 TaxID=355249 RepID=UPI002D21D00B|nr:DUF6082 family protein [Streptomyces sp. Tu6071]
MIDTYLDDPDGVLVMAGDESRAEQTRIDMVCNSQMSFLTMLWRTDQITADHLRTEAKYLMSLPAFHTYWERNGRDHWDDTVLLRQFSKVMEREYQAVILAARGPQPVDVPEIATS